MKKNPFSTPNSVSLDELLKHVSKIKRVTIGGTQLSGFYFESKVAFVSMQGGNIVLHLKAGKSEPNENILMIHPLNINHRYYWDEQTGSMSVHIQAAGLDGRTIIGVKLK